MSHINCIAELAEAKAELAQWKAVALYLADCHAANLDIAMRKSCSKNERGRLTAIARKCKEQINRERLAPNMYRTSTGGRWEKEVSNRLQEGIEEIEDKFPEPKCP